MAVSRSQSKDFIFAPELPVLNRIVDLASSCQQINFENTAIVGVQHLLETTESLFQGLIDLGAKPENLFFSGKFYSSSSDVVKSMKKAGVNLTPDSQSVEPGYYRAAKKVAVKYMWNEFLARADQSSIQKVIILDEGGGCFENIPDDVRFNYEIAAIEQTRGGLYSPFINTLTFPLINVAMSAAKRFVEPPLISRAILERVQRLLPKYNLTAGHVCGVVGNGAIGFALVRHLLSEGFRVVVYDENENAFDGIISNNCYRVGSVESVISNAHCIFGCTGKDVTQSIDALNFINTNKIFVSCSSEDVEFRSLLRSITAGTTFISTLDDITYTTEYGHSVILARGGFPINFDNSPISVPSQDIQMTRGLLLGACIQAMLIARRPVGDGVTINSPMQIALDPYLQRLVVKFWKEECGDCRAYPPGFFEQFDDILWVIKNSGDKYYENPIFKEYFSNSAHDEVAKNLAC